MHKMRLRPGLCPGPHWAKLQRSRSTCWIRGCGGCVEKVWLRASDKSTVKIHHWIPQRSWKRQPGGRTTKT